MWSSVGGSSVVFRCGRACAMISDHVVVCVPRLRSGVV